MKKSKRHVGDLVETPDGNLGIISGYDEAREKFDVQLESGKLTKFKPGALKQKSPPDDVGFPCPFPGGSDDW